MRPLIGLTVVAATCSAALAGSATFGFDTDPAAAGSGFVTGSNISWQDPVTGDILDFYEDRDFNGVGEGGNPGGYLAITRSSNSQYTQMLFPDFDAGLVVKAFTFECDIRAGNATGNDGRPADGFSLNYARATDPAVTFLEANPGSSDTSRFAIPSAPEGGTTTGLSICFDTWSGNTWPTGETDIEGIIVRVDNTTVLRHGMPTRNGSCTDVTSLQTGPYDAATGGDYKGLCWAPLKVELTEAGALTVQFKGATLLNAAPTSFAPSPGRILLAGRTGGANQNNHIDNLKITTVPANNVIVANATGNPVGFRVGLIDSGAAVADLNTVTLTLDGTAVTPTQKEKTGINSTIGFWDVTKPLVAGSTHTIVVSVKDTQGQSVTETRTFTVPAYVTLPPEWAVQNPSQTGFNVVVHQTAARGQENTIARAEQQLQGLRGANVADLSTGFPGGVYAETKVINYSQIENSGLIGQNGYFYLPADPAAIPVERQVEDVSIPGIPSITEFPVPPETDLNYTENIATEITSFLQFPEAGVYHLIFNSDDGFRTTAYKAGKETLSSVIVGQADVGRGASDTVSIVYVPTPGAYPFRTVWFEGGGGANLEWSAMEDLPNPKARALINHADSNVKAFRSSGTPSPAAVVFTHPARETGSPYVPTIDLIAKIQDGTAAVDQGSIKMFLNGTEVTTVKNKTGNITTVTYNPANPLPPGTHELKVSFADGATTREGMTTFTVAGVTVPASLALPASAVNKANIGFLAKTVQHAQYQSYGNLGTDTYAAETQVHGLLGLPNTADLSGFTGPGGHFVETGVLNYNQVLADSGYFTAANPPSLADTLLPGIPGIHTVGTGTPPSTGFSDNGTDSIAAEWLTVLDLQPGLYTLNVNSDDGFRATFGNPSEWWTLPVVVGEFSGGRGNGGGFGDGTTFSFVITQAGLYPFRLLWYEGGGGANLEVSSRTRDPQTGYALAVRENAILLNDVSTPGHIKAYQYPLNSPGAPYVKHFAPGRDRTSAASQARAGSDAKVVLHLVEGTATLNAAAVSMTVDGAAVTPTVTKAGGEMHIEYMPAAPWADGLHTAVVTFGDRSVSWQFRTTGAMKTPTFFIEAEDFDNNNAGLAVASQMPYSGGAYAGLTAVATTDFNRGDTGDSPLYRHGVSPRTPMDRTGDRTRGLGEVKVNYKLGWVGGGNYFDYTRDIPAGTYNIYAAVSHGDGAGTSIGGQLAKVTGGTTEPLGVFQGGGTSGWGNNALLPLKTAADGDIVALPLSGTTSLRYTVNNGDWDFMLLVPAASTAQPEITGIRKNTDGTVTIEWTGGGTLQAGPTVLGPWQDVAGASSPFTFVPSEAMLFGRIRQ